MRNRHRLALAAILALLIAPTAGRSEEVARFKVVFADGTISPQRLEVPAGKPFELEVSNTGTSPAEFESKELHKEKVIAPKATTVVSFKKLTPGEYGFFDENQPNAAPGTLVVK